MPPTDASARVVDLTVRACLTCGLTFPTEQFPYAVSTGRTHTCTQCSPRSATILTVAALAADHILRCVGASALLDLGEPAAARLVLDGYWPALRTALPPREAAA